LACQPPASSTFLSEQTGHHQSASSTFLSEKKYQPDFLKKKSTRKNLPSSSLKEKERHHTYISSTVGTMAYKKNTAKFFSNEKNLYLLVTNQTGPP
jgi:hypothetical protein